MGRIYIFLFFIALSLFYFFQFNKKSLNHSNFYHFVTEQKTSRLKTVVSESDFINLIEDPMDGYIYPQEREDKLTDSFCPPEALKDTYNLKNWGLFNSICKNHIDAIKAWKIERGSRKVIVAVIDTGIDPLHPQIKDNLWKGVHNGEVIYGWDFSANRPNPVDENGHGTHVAGIIGAKFDLENRVSGVAPEISIMALKYYNEKATGDENLRNSIAAINFAVDNGASIINYSGGGPGWTEAEFKAIARAEDRGILVVAAAGNEDQNLNRLEHSYYPAEYDAKNIIGVAATDTNNDLLASSNWGDKIIHVAAPGSAISSTTPGGKFQTMTGTSQATAFVSGIAALLLSKDPDLTPTEIKQIICDSVDKFPQLDGYVSSGGRVNAYSALKTLLYRKRYESSISKYPYILEPNRSPIGPKIEPESQPEDLVPFTSP